MSENICGDCRDRIEFETEAEQWEQTALKYEQNNTELKRLYNELLKKYEKEKNEFIQYLWDKDVLILNDKNTLRRELAEEINNYREQIKKL